MKRVVYIICFLLVIVTMTPAFAAGKLDVVQENFYVIDDYDLYAYAFAKVENIGNKDIQVSNILLEIFDEEGDALTSTDWGYVFGECLAPGEYCYIKIYDYFDDSINDPAMVDDYLLTVSGKSTTEKRTVWLETTGEYKENVRMDYWTYNLMCGTVKNNTDQDLYGIVIVMVLFDEDGNILFLDGEYLGDNCALNAGSSISVRIPVYDSFVDYFEKNNLVPASVDVVAYAYVEE